MNLFVDQLLNYGHYKKIIEDLKNNETPLAIHGLTEENLAHISYGLYEHLNKSIYIITYSEIRAKKIAEDLKTFLETQVEYLSSRQFVFYDIDAHTHEIMDNRIKVMDRLLRNEKLAVVTSCEALLSKVMKPEIFKKSIKKIKFGEEINLEETIRFLIEAGYERRSLIEGKGQFSVRGGIIDFYPSDSQNPYRIELFDQEVDSIREFDMKNQRSIDNKQEVEITPVKEIIISEEEKIEISKKMKFEMEELIKELPDKEEKLKTRISEKFNKYVELLSEKVNLENTEFVIPYIEEKLSNLISYMDRDGIYILDEPQRIEENAENFIEDFNSKFAELYGYGEVLKSHRNIHFNFEDIFLSLKEKNILTTTTLAKNYNRLILKDIVSISTKVMQSFYNKMDLLAEELKRMKLRGYKVIIMSGNEERGKRLKQNLFDYGVISDYTENITTDIKSGQVIIYPKTIHRGFEYPGLKFAIISDKEIFGASKKRRNKKRRKDGRKIESFTDLKVGDYVVHEGHGIGKYLGLQQLEVQGVKKEYLTVKYSGDDKLFIPVNQMDLIQKYIGSDSGKPKVNKLGSGEWAKAKAKSKKEIEDMAEELIELYAKRHKAKGFQFSKDNDWQKQFEDMFPYEETQDQLRCIEEIKKDMEQPKVMDRLLCGDVGYGKTEVALRAAFKATLDGKQVALLVPTTILAQQHYNSIVERFSEFPVKIEMLSRFRTAKQQKKIMEDVKTGNVDIIVGTHRLLSKDLKFKDLGLLIVDEEQRFGVRHKETLKQLKESVDVLTLTATPIPRTLHMSLISVRDLSVIEEPPEERFPIQTYVVEHNENMIRDAIMKEISRDGQVYYVYNRVEGIESVARKIQNLVPEARIGIGHGQMSERQLENTMIDFMDGEYDVLVCTTIIETGLDISRVNTIIIQDADKMGLSQLYQLRGRVGRSNRVAFSYFMHEKNKSINEIAEKRLKAIKEFTEFGSGFKIAMRDLEIRGAGSLLGAKQHGQMAQIGYDLYVKFLEDAVKKLKGEEVDIRFETSIELNLDAYIPKYYIENEEHKIEMYKKMASIENEEDLNNISDELLDRFGDIPKQVINLMKVSLIKYKSKKTGVKAITQGASEVSFEFVDVSYLSGELMNHLYSKFRRLVYADATKKIPTLKYKLNNNNKNKILEGVERFIEEMYSFHNNKIEI